MVTLLIFNQLLYHHNVGSIYKNTLKFSAFCQHTELHHSFAGVVFQMMQNAQRVKLWKLGSADKI